ncbi:hypothetical protein ACI2LF_20245 [Kribbella sp. NPDC020789]
MNALRAELRKVSTLPAVWAGLALTLFGSIGITLLETSRDSASAFSTAIGSMPVGTIGAVVVGVVAFSSEYTANNADAGGGRQIITTLTVTAGRVRLLIAKITTIVLLVVASAVVTLPTTIGIAWAVTGRPLGFELTPCVGGTVYWVLSGLLGFAITVMIRNGVVPLIVLIVNSSLVSVSYLLTKLTSLAFWLPDLAGRRLFGGVRTVDGGLDAVPGGLVMAGWAVLFCVAAGFVFTRRDA